MQRTIIRGDSHSLRLGALPNLDDLNELRDGKGWGQEAAALLESLKVKANSASKAELRARRLELESGDVEEVHEDYLLATTWNVIEVLQISEESLPVGQRVCVLGAYDMPRGQLTGRRFRFGPRLTVYRGGADEVLRRVGRDVSTFFKFAPILLLMGLALLLLAWGAPDHLPEAVLVKSPSDAESAGVNGLLIWGLVVAVPIVLLWLHWWLDKPATRSHTLPETPPPKPKHSMAQPSSPGASSSSGSQNVHIANPILLAAAKKLAKSGGERAKWVQFDGVSWYFTVDHIQDTSVREKAHDVLTRYLTGEPVTQDETLWIMRLLQGDR